MKVMAPKNKVESTIHAQGTEISILSSVNENEEDFISLTVWHGIGIPLRQRML